MTVADASIRCITPRDYAGPGGATLPDGYTAMRRPGRQLSLRGIRSSTATRRERKYAHAVTQRIPLSNDEIEVACDRLWFVKRESGLSGVAEALWERMQPIRHGDYGGTASTELSTEKAGVVDAGEFTDRRVPLDDDELRS
jgi:hypothetical protein